MKWTIAEILDTFKQIFMAASDNTPPSTGFYDLPLDPDEALFRQLGQSEVANSRAALSVKNAAWFCNLRWGIVGILSLCGVLGLIPGFSETAGFKLNSGWLFITAFLLSVINIVFLHHIRKFILANQPEHSEWNLRLQIAIDLLVLSLVVHFLGSIETYAPFLYLLHIVLACIFLSRTQSAIILLLAFFLYLGVLMLEMLSVIDPRDGIYTDLAFRQSFSTLQIVTNLISLFCLWATIWFLTSRIAKMIFIRERDLAVTNQRLLRTQTEKTKHMLRTTHELKAPFAAIHANTQLLVNGYCGSFTPEALAVLRRIAERGRRLSADIQAMLQLANLSSVEKQSLKWARLDLSDVLKKCLDPLLPIAEQRKLQIEMNFEPALIFGVEDHLNMLFSNIIANAIYYSHPGAKVTLSLQSKDATALVKIQDFGIGIAPQKLSRIFEEHYRTEEAAAHNKESSGLGLAIVRQVAQTHKYPIHVESAPNTGTTFLVSIPLLPRDLNSKTSTRGIKRIQRLLGYLRGI